MLNKDVELTGCTAYLLITQPDSAVAEVLDHRYKVLMRCLSCHEEVLGSEAETFKTILMCRTCKELADRMLKELEREHAKLWAKTESWLQTHILRGGLHHGKLSTKGGSNV